MRTKTGPVVDNIKSEASRTGQEFRDLSNSKVASDTTTATGQPLTYYHSLLYSLLSVSDSVQYSLTPHPILTGV